MTGKRGRDLLSRPRDPFLKYSTDPTLKRTGSTIPRTRPSTKERLAASYPRKPAIDVQRFLDTETFIKIIIISREHPNRFFVSIEIESRVDRYSALVILLSCLTFN